MNTIYVWYLLGNLQGRRIKICLFMSTYQQNIHTIYIFTQYIIVQILASLTDPSPGLSQGGGGARGAQAPPVFGRSVNPISTSGGQIIPTQYYESPPDFRPCDGPKLKFIYSEKPTKIRRNNPVSYLSLNTKRKMTLQDMSISICTEIEPLCFFMKISWET